MEPKNSQTFKINKKYHKDILDFIKLNEIGDVDVFINKCFKKGFDIQRFGLLGNETEIREVEKIIEKIVEVPVEKIVEIIKEIPTPPVEIEVIKYVDREVIKEVPVEKIVSKIEYIYDKTPSELEEKIFHLEQELDDERQKFSTKTIEMENIFQNEMSKKDDEIAELRRNLDEVLDKPPVEIIKEVVIEKPSDDTNAKKLQETLVKLRQNILDKDNKIVELEGKISELMGLQEEKKALYLRGSNLDDKLYK